MVAIVRLFLLYAILIFAKKAPDMIKDMLKIKGDNIGLKGLNIKNKMGEAALVGKHVKKGMTGIEGKTKGVLGGGVSGFVNTKGGLRKRLKGGVKGAVTGSKNAGKAAMEKGDSKGLFTGGYNNVKPAARGGRPTIWDRARDGGTAVKNWVQDKGAPIGLRGYDSLEIVRANEAAKLKENLTKLVGGHNANKMMDLLIKKHGVNGVIDFTDTAVFDALKNDLKGLSEAYSDSSIRTILTGWTGNIPMDSLLSKRNLLDARDKLFSQVQAYDSEYLTAIQSNDIDKAKAIKKKRSEAIDKAYSNGLFTAVLGVPAINVTRGARDADGDYIFNGDIADDLTNITNKNKKALAVTEKDIAARDEVEKPDGSKS